MHFTADWTGFMVLEQYLHIRVAIKIVKMYFEGFADFRGKLLVFGFALAFKTSCRTTLFQEKRN